MSVPWNLRSRQPGDELAELLWDNNGPHFPPAPFQPFTCSAAGSNRAHELLNKRHGIPVHHHHEDGDQDMPPWLHCPVIVDDGDSDTAPLPPDYCAAGLLSGYPALHAAAPQPQPEPDPMAAAPAGVVARPSSDGGALPPETTAQLHPGNGVMNFTFFSRPLLQRPHPSSVAATTNPELDSTVVPQTTPASRLRNTPLFSDQRMAWLQPPPTKEPRASLAPPPPPPQLAAPPATDPHVRHAVVVEAPATLTRHGLRPDARAAVTSSSVCSGNGDDQFLLQENEKKNSHHPPTAADYSVSPDEDVDDEPGAARRSRGTKRSRTAEVHNLSERRRRDRINEKMRALQELIPNCNKIDKASMLEEAIEYLKTLQVQVQMMMMSMGTTAAAGMYGVPPMLMQMQHHVAPPFPHLGMGQLGFGMGAAAAYDMLPRFGAQFPYPVMPGAAAPLAMPHGSVFGIMPGAGHVMPSSSFLHVNGTAAPAAEQREGSADDGPAPGGGSGAGAGDRRPPPPVPIAPEGGDRRQNLQQQQHSKHA